MFPYFTFFGRVIGSYAILSMLGLAVCCIVVARLGKKVGLEIEDGILAMVAAAVGLFFGGHLLYAITNLNDLIACFRTLDTLTFQDVGSILASAFGGMVFYGGFLGGLVGLLIFARFSSWEFRGQLIDLYAVTTPLFHTFGRIGCFLGGCCYGIESSIGFTVTNNTLVPELNGVRRFPVQLAEAGCNLILFLILLILFKGGRHANRLIYCYLLLYPPVRFFLEFLRGDAVRGFWLGLSTSQWISLILFTITVIQLLRHRLRHPSA
ncbi:MAG: prolipoprotein diacylglyceryl transferase [Eubacteriales bacterium]